MVSTLRAYFVPFLASLLLAADLNADQGVPHDDAAEAVPSVHVTCVGDAVFSPYEPIWLVAHLNNPTDGVIGYVEGMRWGLYDLEVVQIVGKEQKIVSIPKTRYGVYVREQHEAVLRVGLGSLDLVRIPENTTTKIRIPISRMFDTTMHGTYELRLSIPLWGPDLSRKKFEATPFRFFVREPIPTE